MERHSQTEDLKRIVEQAVPEEGLSLSERLEKVKDGDAKRKARKLLQISLLALLIFEILFIAYVMLSQGTRILLFTHTPFGLSEWAFDPFINIAIGQTCFLIWPIAKDLFPGKENNKKHNHNP